MDKTEGKSIIPELKKLDLSEEMKMVLLDDSLFLKFAK